MLWNWNTIDACFLSQSWKINSHGAFAALCLGVITLVILLEFLRRIAKFYDKHLVRKHRLQAGALAIAGGPPNNPNAAESGGGSQDRGSLIAKNGDGHFVSPHASFQPNAYQQMIRALLHTLQFAVAYWIMLLAMYYNGYIIICIFIGAFLGAFIFGWERLGVHSDETAGYGTLDPTACCG
ncbi:Ctr copper transporter [Pseudomassariella vexata]|uniref:Copper transport protein n=1 Tax=Pseudomassariella vexata TaxID=1141098 RepID=A0A1Y2DEY8_9PEZI|nr:Ctr copper transporter [Pseudomassariella vexata]ORY57757.1 Ctr copper transporter [Pseudomassariella vexata]